MQCRGLWVGGVLGFTLVCAKGLSPCLLVPSSSVLAVPSSRVDRCVQTEELVHVACWGGNARKPTSARNDRDWTRGGRSAVGACRLCGGLVSCRSAAVGACRGVGGERSERWKGWLFCMSAPIFCIKPISWRAIGLPSFATRCVSIVRHCAFGHRTEHKIKLGEGPLCETGTQPCVLAAS